MLDKLDELGIADNTIVMYSTDNGPRERHLARRRQHAVPRPEGHQLGRRLARAVLHALARQDQGRHGAERHRVAHRHVPDAAGGCRRTRTSTEKLLEGYKVGDKTFKVHLDGYNLLPYLTGEAKESPRNAIFYISDDGDVMAVRVGDYKFHLAEQRANTMRRGPSRS